MMTDKERALLILPATHAGEIFSAGNSKAWRALGAKCAAQIYALEQEAAERVATARRIVEDQGLSLPAATPLPTGYVPNLTALIFARGWQGGTLAQMADELGVPVNTILTADDYEMGGLLRLCQKLMRAAAK